MKILRYIYAALIFLVLIAACSQAPIKNEEPIVLATTSIIGDVAGQIGGEMIEVRVLLPRKVDPHSFQPTPQDLAAIEQAALLLTNGFGLEESFEDLIENTAKAGAVVVVSQGISPIYFRETTDDHGIDPHVWMSPTNVAIWVENIAAALSELDPEHADQFHANALVYQEELVELDEWIKSQFSLVPADQRLLVADHETFNYLALAYELEVVGSLTGFSSLAESSAQELAALEDAISLFGVPAIFVSTTVPPGLAEQVAEDTGVQVVRVYSGALSAEDGPAATYLEMMRYTIGLMVMALK